MSPDEVKQKAFFAKARQVSAKLKKLRGDIHKFLVRVYLPKILFTLGFWFVPKIQKYDEHLSSYVYCWDLTTLYYICHTHLHSYS